VATKTEIGAVLSMLAAAYPSFELRKETTALYAEMLEDLPGEVLFIAGKQHIAQSTFFPRVAELRSTAFGLLEMSTGAPKPIEAWAWVCEWIHCSGRGRDGGHELVERAVRAIGGWESLGQRNVDDRHWTQRQFMEAYEDMLDTLRRDQTLIPEARRLVDGQDGAQRVDRGEILRLIRGIGRMPPAVEQAGKSCEGEPE